MHHISSHNITQARHNIYSTHKLCGQLTRDSAEGGRDGGLAWLMVGLCVVWCGGSWSLWCGVMERPCFGIQPSPVAHSADIASQHRAFDARLSA